jgi:iron complex outermembrane receptor protein
MTPAPDASAARRLRPRRSFPIPLWIFALALAHALTAPARAADPAALPVREAREISVTAARGERNLLDVPAHVTVLDRAAIERSGAANLPELLRREAGIFVSNTTTNAEGYSLESRGFGNGGGNGCRTLVLVDGRRANEPDSGCPDWTFLTLDQIERVEIVRGAGSTAYGDNALGGVIQIFTRGASAEGGTRAALALERASFDAERANAFVSQPLGALRLGASASWDDTDGYRERADLNNKRWQIDLAAPLGDAGEVGLMGGYASSERSRPGTLDAAEADEDPEAASANLDYGRERERFLQGALELALPFELSLRATPSYRHSRARNHFETTGPFGFAFDADTDADSAGLDLQLARELRAFEREVRVVAGAELRQDDIDVASTFASNDARRRLWGVFVQAEAWLLDDVLLSLALRRDRSDLEGRSSAFPGRRFDAEHAVWSPRAALTWRFREEASVYVSYARGFRFPNLDESFGSFGFAPELEPERAHGVEVGGAWRSERAGLRAVLYAMYVDDEIFFDPLAPPFGRNDNVDEVRHLGVEISARVALTPWLDATATFTEDDVEVRKDAVAALEGERLPITPEHRGSLGLEASLPLGFEASLAGLFVGDRRVANDVLGTAPDLDGYATLDARIAWRRELAPGVALTLEGRALNLTDSDYSDFAGYSTFSFPPASRFYPAPERNFAFGARIELAR